MSDTAQTNGRPRTRPEASYFRGNIFFEVPLPLRDETGDLIGYEWTKTDLIKLLQDLPSGYSPFTEAEGFHFSTNEAEVITNFIINECVFPEGPLTGQPFVPERWQWAIYLNTYCWFEDAHPETRRFNEVFLYVPRKNGKTSAFGAIPSLISVYVDPEKRSQNFCCAADVEQAALNFRHASYMVEQNPKLLNKLTQGKVRHGSRYMEHNNGRTLKVLSSIAETKHGLSPNYVGVDEVHAHSNRELIDVMVTGTAARRSPLVFYTTTADYDRPSVCNDLYRRSKAVAQGLQSDPNLLPVIYEALPTDDWEDPAVWEKANPNFRVSVNEKYFTKEINRVRNSPKLLNRFLRLHLNIKTSVETSWIYPYVWAGTNPSYPASELLSPEEIRYQMKSFPDWFSVLDSEQWDASFIDIHLKHHAQYFTWFFKKIMDLQEAPCFAAYDNAAVKDIASLALFFPETHDLLSFNWVPTESIEKRSVEEQIPYQTWFNCGLVNNTPQTTIDEDHVVKALTGYEGTGILHHFQDLRMVAFDNWGSNYISNQLQNAGLRCRAYPQSYSGMNQPCKTMESWLEQQNLFHGGNPVLAWMIGNTMLSQNNNDQVRPDRKNSTDKIDGIVSALMAIGAWLYDDDKVIELAGLMSEED
jgi:phage terminase large subunit-like protein